MCDRWRLSSDAVDLDQPFWQPLEWSFPQQYHRLPLPKIGFIERAGGLEGQKIARFSPLPRGEISGARHRLLFQFTRRRQLVLARQTHRDFSAAASLFSSATKVCGRFWTNRYGPSRRRA